MATVIGNVFDLSAAPFPAAVPVLEIMPSVLSIGGGTVYPRRKVTVTVSAAGEFSFTMVGTDTVTPDPEPVLVVKWLDPADSAGTGYDEFRYLHVPAGSGTYTIDQVLDAPVQAGSIVYGMGAPPDYLSNVIYIDISGTVPVLYGPTNGGI